MRKASLVTDLNKVRCIYEIEKSGQKFNVRYPLTKISVNVFPVINADIKIALEKLEITLDGKMTPNGLIYISNKLCKELQTINGSDNNEKLELLNIISNCQITPNGLRILSNKMLEEIASITDGELAINECDSVGGLLKFIK